MDPEPFTSGFLFNCMAGAFLVGASLAWIIARAVYLKAGTRAGLGMLRRGNMPDNL